MTALPPWLSQWVCSTDRCPATLTIVAVLLDVPVELVVGQHHGAAPADASDLRKCVRLLDLAERHGMGWRARIQEVGDRAPSWAPVAPIWSELEARTRVQGGGAAALLLRALYGHLRSTSRTPTHGD